MYTIGIYHLPIGGYLLENLGGYYCYKNKIQATIPPHPLVFIHTIVSNE